MITSMIMSIFFFLVVLGISVSNIYVGITEFQHNPLGHAFSVVVGLVSAYLAVNMLKDDVKMHKRHKEEMEKFKR